MSNELKPHKPLTPSEKKLLSDCVSIIQKGVEDISISLMEIRGKRLYRETHSNFNDYVRDTFSIDRRYADRLIAAHETKEKLGAEGITGIDKESQLRELGSVPADHLEDVVSAAEAAAEKRDPDNPHVTAKDLSVARKELEENWLDASDSVDDSEPEATKPTPEEQRKSKEEARQLARLKLCNSLDKAMVAAGEYYEHCKSDAALDQVGLLINQLQSVVGKWK